MKCDGRWHRYRYVDENGVTRWPGYKVAPNPVIPWAETLYHMFHVWSDKRKKCARRVASTI